MTKNITISDVSKKAGVSKSTVSNYMNGKTYKMSDKTKKKIEEVMEEMGYVPNISARRLANKDKSRTICLVIPDKLTHIFDNMYYPFVLDAIENISNKLNYNILIFSRNRKNQKQILYLMSMATTMVDGFIFFDLDENDKSFKSFEKAGIPYICVGKINDYDDYYYVASDHFGATKSAFNHLIDLGHKKIGIIHLNHNSIIAKTRKMAMEEILGEGLILEENIIEYNFSYDLSIKETFNRFCEILNKEDRPTAFILTSASQQSFLLAADSLNLNIPEDISYIDIEYYQDKKLLSNESTRIEVKASIIAEKAFMKLLNCIDTEPSNIKSEIVELDLTVGMTTDVPKYKQK